LSTTAERLAAKIARLEARLTAVERGSQMRRTSIEGGTLAVNDPDGVPVLLVGQQDDGTYAVVGVGAGRVVANDLDLPAGSITETDISDGSISTPKLRANAITADKIAAGAITAEKISGDAIDGRTITGGTLRTAATGARLEIGQGIQSPTGDDALRWVLYGVDTDNPFIAAGDTEAERYLYLRGGNGPAGFAAIRLGEGGVIIEARPAGAGATTRIRLTPTFGVEVTGGMDVDVLKVGGVDQGRGLVGRAVATGDPVVTMVASGETVIRTVAANLTPSRAYEVMFRSQVRVVAAGDLVMRVKRPAGTTVVDTARDQFVAMGGNRRFQWQGGFVTGASVPAGLLSVAGVMSTGSLDLLGFGSMPLEVRIDDVGPASAYPGLPVY
jgi:hypothetical protein